MHIVFAVLQTIETISEDEGHSVIAVEKIVTFILAFFICCVLASYSLFRPNEFSLMNTDPLLYQTRNNNRIRRTTIGRRRTMMASDDSPEIKLLTTSIKECKIKTENNKQNVYFSIIVSASGKNHTVRRTYAEFDSLHKNLRLKFPVDNFPYLDFPSFPLFHNNSYNLDQRMKALNEYLTELCFPEFMASVLLDFLEVHGAERACCLDTHNSIVNEERHLSIYSNESTMSRHGSFAVSYYQPQLTHTDETDAIQLPNYHLHSFINIKIIKWIEESSHVQYLLQWKIAKLSQEGTIKKRFNDFYELHKKLKKTLSPAQLPKFPSKNYLQNFRSQDSHALEIRKRKLEDYIGHILNDAAFLCIEALEFIGCPVDVETV